MLVGALRRRLVLGLLLPLGVVTCDGGLWCMIDERINEPPERKAGSLSVWANRFLQKQNAPYHVVGLELSLTARTQQGPWLTPMMKRPGRQTHASGEQPRWTSAEASPGS